ncbi:MAG: FG-GAP-like repeat-containing protein, partial [Planctomycetota bacterium]
TEDFDGDGYPDLLWRNRANGKNQIWFMDGTSLSPDIQVMSTVGASWDVVATDTVTGGG